MKAPTIQQDKRSGEYFLLVPTHTTSKAEAKRFVSDSHARELITTRSQRSAKVTINEAVNEWCDWSRSIGNSEFTTTHLSGHMDEWVRFAKLTGASPAGISEKQISPWVNNTKVDLKLASRQVKLAAVRALFKFCSAKGYCTGNPSQLVRVNFSLLSHKQKETRPRRVFNDAEIGALLSEVNRKLQDGCDYAPFWAAAIPIGRWTGLRLGDICQLEWDCLEKPGVLTVWTEKRDRRVELPLNDKLTAAIEGIAKRSKQFLFPHQRDMTRNPKRRPLLSTQFSRICAGAGVEGRTFHDLRSTYASACLAAGIPMPHISRSLGHSSGATTNNYIVKGGSQ